MEAKIVKLASGKELVYAVLNGKEIYKWNCQCRKDVYEAIDKVLEENLEGGIKL